LVVYPNFSAFRVSLDVDHGPDGALMVAVTLAASWGLSHALRYILEPETTLSVSVPDEPCE